MPTPHFGRRLDLVGALLLSPLSCYSGLIVQASTPRSCMTPPFVSVLPLPCSWTLGQAASAHHHQTVLDLHWHLAQVSPGRCAAPLCRLVHWNCWWPCWPLHLRRLLRPRDDAGIQCGRGTCAAAAGAAIWARTAPPGVPTGRPHLMQFPCHLGIYIPNICAIIMG